jgi:hypothetical protein
MFIYNACCDMSIPRGIKFRLLTEEMFVVFGLVDTYDPKTNPSLRKCFLPVTTAHRMAAEAAHAGRAHPLSDTRLPQSRRN